LASNIADLILNYLYRSIIQSYTISLSTKQQMVKPYENTDTGKKIQVEEMFDHIAHRYDFLNHFLSLGIDYHWRRKTVKSLLKSKPEKILDIATGTGDLAIELYRLLKPEQITGIDLSVNMLAIGQKKIESKNLSNSISFQQADAEKLPFANNTFDAVSVGFGVRNFENLEKGVEEMFRVMKNNAQLRVLEFSKPRKGFFQWIFTFYFKNILPRLGKFISGDASAYTYLPKSVDAFPERDLFRNMLQEAGFKNCRWKEFTFGTCCLYMAEKSL